MNMSGVSGVTDDPVFEAQYSARTAKLAQNQQRQEGEAAVALIEGAAVAPPASYPDGRGRLLDVIV